MRWQRNPAYVPGRRRSPLGGPWQWVWALACAAIFVFLVASEMYVGTAVFVGLVIIALGLERRGRHESGPD